MVFLDLGHTPVVDDRAGNPSHPGIDIAGLCQSLFRLKPSAFYPFHAGANFAVSRAVIRQRPREFFQRALNVMLSSEFGPWEIERLWPLIFPARSPRPGIVTAATSDVFFDLQQLLKSLEQFDRNPVEVFDLGLDGSAERLDHTVPSKTSEITATARQSRLSIASNPRMADLAETVLPVAFTIRSYSLDRCRLHRSERSFRSLRTHSTTPVSDERRFAGNCPESSFTLSRTSGRRS